MLLLPYITYNFMLTKSRILEDWRKALFSVPLLTLQSFSLMITYIEASQTSFIFDWLH